MIRRVSGAGARLLLIPLGLALACGEAEPPEPASAVPPISGAALDAVQANLREIVNRDLGGAVAERVRVERSEDGRRAVVHASLTAPRTEAEYVALCRALSEAATAVLSPGQSIELHFLYGDAVAHSCGL